MRRLLFPLLLLATPSLGGTTRSDATCGEAGLVLPAALMAFDVYSAHDLVYACSDFAGPAGAAHDVLLSRFHVGGPVAAGGALRFADGQVAGGVEAGTDLFIRNYAAGLVTAGGSALCLDGSDAGCLSSAPPRTRHDLVVAAMNDAAQRLATVQGTPAPTTDQDGRLRKKVPYGTTVLDLTAEDLIQAGGLDLSGPAGAVVIVRIRGGETGITLNGDVTFGLSDGLAATQVLFAFLDATELSLSHVVLPGTVFAPRARVDFLEGRIDGGLYADDLHGFAYGDVDVQTQSITCAPGKSGGQVNHAPFYCSESAQR